MVFSRIKFFSKKPAEPVVEPATWEQLLSKDVRKLYAGRITRPAEFQGYIGLNPLAIISNHIPHNVMARMPIPDKSIDVYQSEDVFEHLPFEAMPAILDDIYRILKPGGLFRLSLPDYRFNLYRERSLKDADGKILFDPGGGGRFENGQVIEGGHLWYPTYEIVRDLLENSRFAASNIKFLHYNTETESVTNKIDYSLGTILRTPDADERAQNPYRAMSIVVDVIK